MRQAAPGTYRLRASREGYVAHDTTRPELARSEQAVTIGPGHRVSAVTIHLWPAASLSGAVVNQEQQGVPNADVRLFMYMHANGRRQLMPVWMGTTGENGQFTASGLEPGEYYVAAYAPLRALTREHAAPIGNRISALTFYPNTHVPDLAAPLQVGAGSQLQLGAITLQTLTAVSLRGQVLAADGTPAPGATVTLVSQGLIPIAGRSEKTVASGPDGSFAFDGVPSAEYSLRAMFKNGTSIHAAEMQISVGNRDIDGARLQLVPSVPVKGLIRKPTAEKAAAGRVQIALSSRETGELITAAQAAADGSFTVPDVPAGSYDVSISGYGDKLYVKSISVGGADIRAHGMSVAGTPPEPMQVVLSDRGAKVSGQLMNADDQPATGAIFVIPAAATATSRSTRVRSISTDQFGNFAAEGVEPGEYVLCGIEHADSDISQNADALVRIRPNGVRVRLDEGAQAALRIRAMK